MLDDDYAAQSFLALAHESRLAALRLLIRVGNEGLPSGEIAARLEVPPTGMSFHLASLERAGLLKAKKAGRKVFYAVDFESLRALIAFLTEDCCQGRPELCGKFLQGLSNRDADGGRASQDTKQA